MLEFIIMFKKTTQIITDEKIIDGFLDRGIEQLFPNREDVKKRLLSGKQLTFYLGVDPTGPSLHFGHGVPLRKLSQLQKMGHKIILLIGDFTATIGDPDKLSARKPLTRKEVLNNCRLYKEQASRFLRFTGANKAELKFNSKWLAKMNFEDVLSLASKMTVDQMLKRDMFQQRIKENRPIYVHEFMYPLMQGYDSLVMNVDGEIGGNDQIFNMLVGRDLVKEVQNRDKIVIGAKLLTDPNGKKMGKTEGNMITFADSPKEMFGKVMSWTDGMIIPGFDLCTDLPREEIKKIEESMASGANPRDAKILLAKTFVAIYYGEEKARVAEEEFVKTFAKGGVPVDVESVVAEADKMLVDVFLSKEIVKSKSEWRRLVEEGAVSETIQNISITDPNIKVFSGTFKVGKRRFIKVTLK